LDPNKKRGEKEMKKQYRNVKWRDFLLEVDGLTDLQLKKLFKITRPRVFKKAFNHATDPQKIRMRKLANKNQLLFLSA
jgi:hypothetical protein